MLRKLLYVLCGLSLIVASCKHDAPIPVNSVEDNYPPEVAKIIVTKCAVSGCHNAASYTANGGILMDSWEHLFQGGATGAAVVPYSPEYSPLLYFVNTDSSQGVVSEPRMPSGQNAEPLSKEEYNTLRDWIKSGAPDKHGNIPFASDAATRQKIYLTIQGCDLICVIDAKSKVVMRYIKIGALDGVSESPHSMRFSEDGRYAYTTLYAGNGVQRINAATDVADPLMKLTLTGTSQWNIIVPSKDGTKFLASNSSAGTVYYYDYETKTSKTFDNLQGAHGIAANDAFDEFYVTGQPGNMLYKIALNATKADTISVDGNAFSNQYGPSAHEIMLSPDKTKLFMTGEKSNELIVYNIADGKITKIPVGSFPQEIAISKKQPYMFVSCSTDDQHSVGDPKTGQPVTFQGSVHIINYNTLQHIGTIKGDFAYVHGIAVDDQNGLLYVASKNPVTLGPQPHHVSSCGGKNGFYNVFDINTWKPAPARRYEVTPEPYSFDARFK